uniref:DNA-directed RNA polymerase n=1 Tax=Cacopsylla melanoneura TaxID=428564 RepID=A0A8D8LS94_9HEMI
MIRMLHLCPLKIFSKRIYYSIPSDHPTVFKSIKNETSITTLLCEQRRKQSVKAALIKFVLKKNKKPTKRKMIEVLQVNHNSSKLVETQIRTLKSSHLYLVQDKKSKQKTKEKSPEPLETRQTIDRSETIETTPLLFESSQLIETSETPTESNECNKEVNCDINNVDKDNITKKDVKRVKDEVVKKEAKKKKEKIGSKKDREQTVITNNKKAEEKAKVTHLIQEKEKLAKETVMNETLLSYTDACVNCDLLSRGYLTLKHYLTPKMTKKARIVDINIFNTLLRAYAEESKLDKVKEILDIVLHQQSVVKPNIDTFAAVVECLGRKSVKQKYTEQIANVEQQMKQNGFCLNDLFVKCHFTGDQRNIVLDAVRQIHPNFVPEIAAPPLKYDCSLLNGLNQSTAAWISPAENVLKLSEVKSAAKDQISTEVQGSVCVKSIDSQNMEEFDARLAEFRKMFDETKSRWRLTIQEAFERDLAVIRAQDIRMKTNRSVNIYPFLRVLSTQEYVDVVLMEVMKLIHGSDYYSPTLSTLYRNLGRQVYNKFAINKKQKTGILEKQVELYDQYIEWYMNPRSLDSCSNTRQRWQLLVHDNQDGPSLSTPDVVWPVSVLSSVGKFLYNIIVKDIKININLFKASKNCPERWLPAFYPLFRTGGHTMNEEIKPHPVLTKLFRATQPPTLNFDVTHCPMLAPPVPWYKANKGGYIVSQVPFIRLPVQAQQQLIKLQSMDQQQLYPAFDSLNQLGATPWIVNEPILNVISEVFLNGGSSKLDIPLPSSSFPLPTPVSPTMSQKERHEAFRERCALKRQKSEMFSLWCDALYRLSLAHHFKGRVFWLPHNMDFRGRVYPCPPHLNHLGSDMARSMLMFARRNPLGPEGLNWLKIHCINLTGLKKREPVAERLRYANSILSDILDSADNPLSGRMWWADSENPWQTLACCMEIKAALESDNPAEYMSGYPVHQDGSCNGLQHYAALGRDHAGAVSVNLVPAPAPQDVYSAVAAMVERERGKDAVKGVKIAQVMDGFVKRKVIKQTVMTTVYGVTRYGARLQIAKQLKDIESYPQEFVWSGSSYLMTKTFDCLREMFTSTREIQDWFTLCAKYIALVQGRHVEWVTPLGLPVVQHYHKMSKTTLSTPNMTAISRNVAGDLFNKPNMTKQKNAFPPNFVHSLDSTHMMLTSLHCENAGVTYVSVHDCFWTHPATVHIMNRICRQQFVNLHSQPILEDLSDQLINNYGSSESDLEASSKKERHQKAKLNELLAKVPPKGDFDIRQVLNSVYFFS